MVRPIRIATVLLVRWATAVPPTGVAKATCSRVREYPKGADQCRGPVGDFAARQLGNSAARHSAARQPHRREAEPPSSRAATNQQASNGAYIIRVGGLGGFRAALTSLIGNG